MEAFVSECYHADLMTQTPPTMPGPMQFAAPPRTSRTAVSLLIHAMLMVVTCFIVPLAMDSNIWPIAGLFWSVLCVPVAAVFGAIIGWLLRRRSMAVAMTVAIITAAGLAMAAGAIIMNNR